MNKFLLTIFCLIFYLSYSQAQTDFGVKGGVNITFFKVDEINFGEYPDAEIGFYGGFFADFEIDANLHIQPELLYIGISDFQFLNAPVYLNYNVNNQFHILIGPSLNYFFDFFSNKFKVRADISLAYDLSSNLDLHMKYTLGFEELSPNVMLLGLGYRL
jgi:hypothetical protein